ncbi:uncharacterized protein LOC136733469 [Amia ocellicauda]|uniref:uncharacterized protein LOC136733469 n=1 Tax=Amia ocellicauda TaxID=2972642 RepID=UPI003463C99F
MLWEEELTMCGKGMMSQWGPAIATQPGPKLQDDCGRAASKPRWHKRGRRPSYRGQKGRAPAHYKPYYYYNHKPDRAALRPSGLSLRPVNIQGNRAKGMRAPRNTNQFLMHEKYQLMHMRSDSVGTDSGSDCELDFTDMDSYLGVLENARGGLMDSPDLSPRPAARFCARPPAKRQPLPVFSFGELAQEESLQYFPSEHDVLQSEDFMQRDFIDFCSKIA